MSTVRDLPNAVRNCRWLADAEVAKQDYPAERCVFGEQGWVDEDINVLTAIMNMTHQIQTGTGSK